MIRLFNYLFICFVLGSVLPALGSAAEMRTRILTSLTNVEVEAYLDRNDVIFIPVGVAEVHGSYPVDCEYVAPLALSIKMAEKVDGLVLPHLIYFYPGATSVGKSTVFVSPSEGLAYLKSVARSLLRQGFKTQIYVTGHGPAFATLAPLQMEIMNETKNPILFMDMGTVQRKFAEKNENVDDIGELNKIMYGAYSIVGRLNDMPLSFEGVDLPKDDYTELKDSSDRDEGERIRKLLSYNSSGMGVAGYYSSPYDHGGVPKSITAEKRAQYAKEGVEKINKIVDAMDVEGIVRDLKEHRKYIQEVTVPKYGDLLPYVRY